MSKVVAVDLSFKGRFYVRVPNDFERDIDEDDIILQLISENLVPELLQSPEVITAKLITRFNKKSWSAAIDLDITDEGEPD